MIPTKTDKVAITRAIHYLKVMHSLDASKWEWYLDDAYNNDEDMVDLIVGDPAQLKQTILELNKLLQEMNK